MSTVKSEALIVPGAGLTTEYALTESAYQRVDTAVAEWQEGVAPNLVVSGGYSFTTRSIPRTTEAEEMKKYALSRGVTNEALYIETRSLDTIGNALFTKTDIVIPEGWEKLVVVTSKSHLPRAIRIFEHVYGKDYSIIGIPALEKIGRKEKVWEFLGTAMANEVLRGTKQGDHGAIEERLYDLVPGYADATMQRLATKSIAGLVRKKSM